MSDATERVSFRRPDRTTFCRLDEVGLVVTGQPLRPGRAFLACRVLEASGEGDSADRWCRRCG